MRKLIQYQTDDYPEEMIQTEQENLNRLYDAFTKKYGLINSRGNYLAFAADESYFLLCSLEVLDDEGKFKRKADMFSKRTIKPHREVTFVETASEALALSIGEKARYGFVLPVRDTVNLIFNLWNFAVYPLHGFMEKPRKRHIGIGKASPEVRKYIAQRAELLGAVRLPDNTFRANAGTEVTSDILILQKRDSVIDIEPEWVHLDTDENGITMNSYFVQNPEMILGDMKMESLPDNGSISMPCIFDFSMLSGSNPKKLPVPQDGSKIFPCENLTSQSMGNQGKHPLRRNRPPLPSPLNAATTALPTMR